LFGAKLFTTFAKYIVMEDVKFIDLFCGIGGFRQAMDDACADE
jgi:hypothetical protein